MCTRPLMSVEAYARFCLLRDELSEKGVSNIAQVFVPVGPAVSDQRPSLLCVGRATRGYAENDERVTSYDRVIARNVEILRDRKWAFWAFIRHIVASAASDRNGDGKLSVAWSNLAKIGHTFSNPTPRSCAIQSDACHKALRSEIALLKPAAIVLATGTWQRDGMLEPVFGGEKWTEEQEDLRYKTDRESGALVVHTYHPQGKQGSRDMAHVIGRMVALHIG